MATRIRKCLCGAEGVIADLSSANRWDAIDEMVGYGAEAGLFAHTEIESARASVRRRELITTGIGGGQAFPHGAFATQDAPIFCWILGRSRKGMNWEAVDNNPVHLSLLMLSHTEVYQTRLRFLAQFSALLYRALGGTTIGKKNQPEILSSELPCFAQILATAEHPAGSAEGLASRSTETLRAWIRVGGSGLRTGLHGEPAMRILQALQSGSDPRRCHVLFRVIKRSIDVAGVLTSVACEEQPFDPFLDAVALQASLAPGTELSVTLSGPEASKIAFALEELLIGGHPGNLFEGSHFICRPVDSAGPGSKLGG